MFTWQKVYCNHCCCISLTQDRLVTDAISSAMWKHPNLKELTIGCKCSPSLVNGAMEGITRKGGVIKTVIEDDFPGEL